MTNIFVFGTLCHRPLLERVLDRPVEAETARLPDLAVYLVQGKGLPNAALCRSAGAAAEGWLIRDAGAADVERLAFYLSGLGSEMQEAEVLTASHERVTVTVPLRACPPDACGPLFSFEDWRAEWGDAACDAAREIMAQHGQAELDEIGRLRPYLEARAWALQLGRHGDRAVLGNGQMANTGFAFRQAMLTDQLTVIQRQVHQRWVHGVEIQHLATAIRMSQQTAISHHQGFLVWHQMNVMGANAVSQELAFDLPATRVANHQFTDAGLIIGFGGKQQLTGLIKAAMTMHMMMFSTVNALLNFARQHVHHQGASPRATSKHHQ